MDQADLEGFFNYLTLTKRLSERTVELYMGYYKMVEPELTNKQEYIDAFIQEHKNNPVVRGFILAYLRYRGFHRVVDLPPRPTGVEKKRLPRPISKQELEMFRRGMYKTSFKYGLIFDLTYQGALRRSEVPRIRINSFGWMEWFDNPRNFCKLIVLGKENKERVVLINPETAQSIIDYFVAQSPYLDIMSFINSDQLLFKGTDGKPLTERVIYCTIKNSSKKILGRDIRNHELRHARATELEKMGIQIRDIKNYLGHVNLSTTEIYLHRSEKESIEAIEKIMKNN